MEERGTLMRNGYERGTHAYMNVNKVKKIPQWKTKRRGIRYTLTSEGRN